MRRCLSLAFLLLVVPAWAQSVTVNGPTGKTATLGAAEIAALPRVQVSFTAHGETHAYEGPLLIDVLARVDTPTGRALGGAALANAVLVTAADGYRVAFGLGEADPQTRPNRIILADKADGRPLAAKDGPFKLVVEGDLRPARSIRQVVAIAVKPLGDTSGVKPPKR
jgi:hypothetical protein